MVGAPDVSDTEEIVIDLAVIGVDPGLLTGVSCFAFHDDGRVERQHRQLSPDRVGPFLRSYFIGLTPQAQKVIVRERFVITQGTVKKSPQPDALHVTGVVNDVAQEHCAAVLSYAAGDSKKLSSDKALRQIGWYMPRMQHANDATRQALMYLSQRHNRTYIRIRQAATII